MNKNALGDGNIFLTQLMLLSITGNRITRRKFKTPIAFFTVWWNNPVPNSASWNDQVPNSGRWNDPAPVGFATLCMSSKEGISFLAG